MFLRFLGRLFLYLFILPPVADGVKLAFNASVDSLIDWLREEVKKQNNKPGQKIVDNYLDHPPHT